MSARWGFSRLAHVLVPVGLLLSCDTGTDICACTPPLALGAVRGTVVTSQQQPAANSIVTFYAAAGAVCDVNNREPLLTAPGFQPQVLTDQAGGFATGITGIAPGPRCIWVVAKADGFATDSTVVTAVTEFILADTARDTASVSLTLPAPAP